MRAIHKQLMKQSLCYQAHLRSPQTQNGEQSKDTLSKLLTVCVDEVTEEDRCNEYLDLVTTIAHTKFAYKDLLNKMGRSSFMKMLYAAFMDGKSETGQVIRESM